MTVICIPPTLTVRHGNQATTIKPLLKKVQFNEKVRVRRRTQKPLTEEEFQSIWFSEMELQDRRRKDKKLRYAIAKQPEKFGTDKLLVLGLFNEDQRRARNQRALSARTAVLNDMDVDSRSSHSDDSSPSFSSLPLVVNDTYALHSQAAAEEAYERAVEHAAHVLIMDQEDDSSSQADTTDRVSSCEIASPLKLAHPAQFGVGITV